ncbi:MULTISPECIES: phasin family protein [unclassified Azospirillum]|jgi:phasin family protein|uniref:phasin family protein n=1 Tax=unclassified Azospirillum TaxID=2630922 RepID=UPI001FCDB9EC|nr:MULTISPECIES: phasin family protein [unclassified Azospirillum]
MRAGSTSAHKEKMMVTRTPRGAAGRTSRTPAAPASKTPEEKVVEETAAAVAPPADPVPEITSAEAAPVTDSAPVVEATAEIVADAVEETKQAAVEAVPAPVITKAAKPLAAAFEPKSVEQAVAYTKEQVEKMSKQVFTAFDDVAGFHKENVDAFVASSTILAKGFEALSKELLAFTQGQYEQSVSTAKALLAVKSVKELVDLQTEFAKSSFDAALAEATKVSEAGLKVANQAAEPITARVNATVEKLSKIKAAA